MVICDDCKTMHTCKICGKTEQCRDEIEPGTCDFRNLSQAHGYCIETLTVEEKILFYHEDIFIVKKEECSKCGDGFASNTFCRDCWITSSDKKKYS